MKKLLKVNFVVLIILIIEVITLVAWILILSQTQGDAPIEMGVFGLIFIVLFILSSIVFLLTFIILFAWTIRICYREKRLKYLFLEYFVVTVVVLLTGLLFKLFLYKNMHIVQFVSYSIVFPFMILWGKVRECVNTYSDDMVIRRK